MRFRHWFVSAALLISTAVICFAQADEFREPWNRKAAIALDPFQGNAIDWDRVATAPKVVAVIHRATIGGRKDSKYGKENRKPRGEGTCGDLITSASLEIQQSKQTSIWPQSSQPQTRYWR